MLEINDIDGEDFLMCVNGQCGHKLYEITEEELTRDLPPISNIRCKTDKIQIPTQSYQNLEQVQRALSLPGSQLAIAEAGLDFICTILNKNKDYGDAAWERPLLCPNSHPREGILVRMSDKIKRLQQLATNEAAVKSESYEDTIKDLGAYCLLYLSYPGDKE